MFKQLSTPINYYDKSFDNRNLDLGTNIVINKGFDMDHYSQC